MVRCRSVGFGSFLVAVGCAIGSYGCGDDDGRANGGQWTGTVDTLESGTVLVRNPDGVLWQPGEEWRLTERFRLGALGGDGPDVFGDIRDVELGANGELFVLDGQASRVRVFGPDGEHLRTFGRAGEGPGELRRPAGMTLESEGVLWIMNWGNARYSAFDPSSGEVVEERRRLASFTMIPWPGQFDPSGRLLDIGLGREGQPVILLLDTAFVPHDTLPLPQADDRYTVLFRRGDVPVMSAMVPFAPQPSWAAHPHGGIVVGEGASYRLHRITFRGDTTMTIEVDRAAVPVSRAERDSAMMAFREMSQGAAGGATPDREPRVPATKPAHGAVFVDDQGQTWLRRTSPPGTDPAWDVIAGDGRLLGHVSVPVRPGFVPPSVHGDRMAVVTTVDGVPTIVVYDLVRPRGAT